MKKASIKATREAIVAWAKKQEVNTDEIKGGNPISCHYCGKDIQTVDSKQVKGFFWLVDGEFTIINHDGDKEAVCNKCLEKY